MPDKIKLNHKLWIGRQGITKQSLYAFLAYVVRFIMISRISGNYPTKYKVIALFLSLAYTPIV